jgi:hypothetical protein
MTSLLRDKAFSALSPRVDGRGTQPTVLHPNTQRLFELTHAAADYHVATSDSTRRQAATRKELALSIAAPVADVRTPVVSRTVEEAVVTVDALARALALGNSEEARARRAHIDAAQAMNIQAAIGKADSSSADADAGELPTFSPKQRRPP